MKHSLFHKPTFTLALILAGVAAAVGVSAYNEPIGPYTINTLEPVDISNADQAKTGGLSVNAFVARGNADFKKDLQINGVSQGGNPGDAKTTVTVQSNVLATGTLSAISAIRVDPSWPHTFSSGTLVHTEAAPKPVCADDRGIIVFCPAGNVEPPVPVEDLCDNIPGVQGAPLNADILVEDPIGNPKFCTQVIRGTIWAGVSSVFYRNMANTAEVTNLELKEIQIASVGGRPTTVWPSTEPLKFEWSYCAARNSNYSGPSGIFFNLIGNTTLGQCANFKESYPRISTLLGYGFSGLRPTDAGEYRNGHYVGWDGVTQTYNGNGTPTPRGFFDALMFETTGNRGAKLPGKHDVNLWYTKNRGGDKNHLNVRTPIAKLILNNVKVPAGYKLVLSTNAAKSPGTEVLMYDSNNDDVVTVSGNGSRLYQNNILLWASGAGYATPIPFGRSISVAPGTYRVSGQCIPRGQESWQYPQLVDATISPTSITMPRTGGATITVTCP